MSAYRILTIGLQKGLNGISSAVMNLYRHLDRDVIQWDFLLPKKDEEVFTNYKKGTFIEEIRDLGGRVYYLDYDIYTIARHNRKQFRDLLVSDELLMGVHVHDRATNTYPLWAADKLGKPVKVIQFHSACQKSKAQETLLRVPRDKRTRLRMIAGDQFDRLACSDLGGITGYRGYDFEVFPNAIDTQQYQFNGHYRTLVRAQLGIGQDAWVIGFVGRMYDNKRPLFVCESFYELFKHYPDAHLMMVGSGPDREMCEAFIQNHNNMAGHVHFLGYQTAVDMFYSAMDLLMVPSAREGFPYVCVEAQTAGVLCLVSDEISESVCITPPLLAKMFDFKASASAWADEMARMLKNAPARRSWSYEVQQAGFDIHDAARRLERLYMKRIEAGKTKAARGD